MHYESIRIEEIRKEVLQEKSKVTEKVEIIDGKIYESTRDQHELKESVEQRIAGVDEEI